MNEFYVSKAEINGKDYVEINNSDELKIIVNGITNGQINGIVFYGKEGHIILNIFAEINKFHICIIDEEEGINYYYFNSSVKDEELIDIDGNYFDSNMVCYNQDILKNIIEEFVISGGKYEGVEWFEEEE